MQNPNHLISNRIYVAVLNLEHTFFPRENKPKYEVFKFIKISPDVKTGELWLYYQGLGMPSTLSIPLKDFKFSWRVEEVPALEYTLYEAMFDAKIKAERS